MGFHRVYFGLPRPFRFRVRSRHATSRRTDGRTDRHHATFYNAPRPTVVCDAMPCDGLKELDHTTSFSFLRVVLVHYHVETTSDLPPTNADGILLHAVLAEQDDSNDD